MTDMPSLSAAVKQAATLSEILDRLVDTDTAALSAKDVTVIARRLGKLAPDHAGPGVRVAYLANHTIDALPDYVAVASAAQGIVATSHVGPYNQHFQAVLDPNSGLAGFDPQLIFLSLTMRELAPGLARGFGDFAPADRAAEADRIVGEMKQWAEAAKQATGATLLIGNFASPVTPAAGIADLKDPAGENAFYAKLNLALAEAFVGDDRVYLFDIDRIAAGFGKSGAVNRRLYYLARMDWHERLLAPIAQELVRYIQPLTGRTRKCLVLDLDNTLWGGVIGEDGWDGIKIGPDSPDGAAFADFQRSLLALKRRGIVLAINSKNNRDDVVEAFEKRQGDMPLSLDDFSATEINWDRKHDNIARIAKTLNIGIDSLAFIDDNPAECALVKEMHPSVKVIHFDGDAGRFADLIPALPDFQKLKITAEDSAKTQQYRDNQARGAAAEQAGSLEDYLAGLKTEITIRSATAVSVAPIRDRTSFHPEQPVQREATRRYGPADVEHFTAGNGYLLRGRSTRRTGPATSVPWRSDLRRFAAAGFADAVLQPARRFELRAANSAGLSRTCVHRTGYSWPAKLAALDRLLEYASFLTDQKAPYSPSSEFYDLQGFGLIERRFLARRKSGVGGLAKQPAAEPRSIAERIARLASACSKSRGRSSRPTDA